MIQIDSVDFTYPAAEFRLRVPAFQVAPGEKVAVIGASGSGKSTMMNLLLRFYDTDSGSIRVDGHDIREGAAYVCADSHRERVRGQGLGDGGRGLNCQPPVDQRRSTRTFKTVRSSASRTLSR